MKQNIPYRSALFILTIAWFCTNPAQSQIVSPDADIVKFIDYPVTSGQDPLFVFYQPYGTSVPGALTAVSPQPGNFDFTWTKYNPSTSSFSIPAGADAGVSSSVISGLGDGGFRVHITNGIDVDTSFIAWVMLDNLKVWMEEDANGEVPFNRSGCAQGNFLVVGGFAEADSFFYYDPASADTMRLPNDFSIQWTSDNPDLDIPNATRKETMEANYTEQPPVKDTWYILTVTDSLGMVQTDSVFYDTKHTRAEFTVEYLDKVTMEWDPDLSESWSKDKGSRDAPLTVRFLNKSENGSEFRWVFIDTTEELTGTQYLEDEFSYDTAYTPEYTYLTADEYFYPYLVSTSDQQCTDTFRLEDGIFVVPSQLVIPNVFSPNGDGSNDVFFFKHQSLKSCRITIIDRFGKVVYKQKIDDIYEWEGWNGNLFNSDRPAPEGQYYYVVEALGYDNEEYADPTIFEKRKSNQQQPAQGTSGTDGQATGTNLYTGWLYLFRNIKN